MKRRFLSFFFVFLEKWVFSSKCVNFDEIGCFFRMNRMFFGETWRFCENYTTWELFHFRFRFWIVLEGLNGPRIFKAGFDTWLQKTGSSVYQTDTSLIKSLKILVNRMSLTSIFRNTKRSKWTFGLITNEQNHSNKNPISSRMKIFTISIPSQNGTFLDYVSYDLISYIDP